MRFGILLLLFVGSSVAAQTPAASDSVDVPVLERSTFIWDFGALAIAALPPVVPMGRVTVERSPGYGHEPLAAGFSLFGEAGRRLTDEVGVVGVVNGDFLFGSVDRSQLIALNAGLRFGVRHHFTFAGGPGFWWATGPNVTRNPDPEGALLRSRVSLNGVMGMVRGHISLVLYKNVSLELEHGLNFDGSLSHTFGAGLGGTFF